MTELNGASCPKYVIVQEPPSGASMIHSQGFSFDKRPNNTSRMVSGYGGNFIQQQLLPTQQMCFQQQQAMLTLTDTMNKLRQSFEVIGRRECVKRRTKTSVRWIGRV